MNFTSEVGDIDFGKPDDEVVLSSGEEEGEDSCVEEEDSEDLLLNHRGASNRRKQHSAAGKKKTTAVAPSLVSAFVPVKKTTAKAVAKAHQASNYCFESQPTKSRGRGGRMASQKKDTSSSKSGKTLTPSAVSAWIANQGTQSEGLDSDEGYQPPLAGDCYW